MAIPGGEAELPAHIADAGRECIAVEIAELNRGITTAFVGVIHHTSAMIIWPMFAIMAVSFQVPTDTVVFGPVDMPAGAILHFV
jgi:hypothetical protein